MTAQAARALDATPRYRRAGDLDEALGLLARGGWTPLAGGTDFYPARVGRPVRESLLDLGTVESLRGIARASDAAQGPVLHVGATTTWSSIARAELDARLLALQQAAREIGGIQVQNRATVGGNLCNASPAADGIVALLALDARLGLASLRGRRSLAVDEFVLGVRRTALEPDELLVAIEIPSGSARARSAFLKLGHRRSLVISIAMVAVAVDFDESDRLAQCAIAVGACAPAAVRLRALESRLLGARRAEIVRLFDDAARGEALAPLQPIDDVRATAVYRRHVAIELARRLLCGLAGERSPARAEDAKE
ncbi:MAG: FAD binding domain-containing protein [Burkholderiaceae bacterium]|nr:FAD binding domain-containing protein [Burkholderiaceae bacterium]